MWTLFREKRGTLNLGMRMEQLMAISDFRAHVTQGGKAGYDKFVRYHEADPVEENSLEAVAQMFGVPYEVKNHG